MKIAILSRYPRVDTAPWKLGLLNRLLEGGHEIAVVYTRSALVDQVRAGLQEFGLDALSRYRRARQAGGSGDDDRSPDSSVTQWAAQNDVPVLRHRTIGDPALLADLRSYSPDLLLLAGADIVPAAVLEVPAKGAINPHYGLLPTYRGMNVAEWSVFHGDPVGVTVHYVTPGIDTGDILEREAVEVEAGDTLQSIRVKQQALSARLLLQAVERIDTGRVKRIPQREEEGRQFYRMHPSLRERVEQSLESGRYSSARAASSAKARNIGA